MANRNHTAYFYQPGQGPRTYIPFIGTNDDDAAITSHHVDHVNHTVDMWVTWRNAADGLERGKLYSEYDVQTAKPQKVYAYWRKLGGRCTTTKLSKYHVFDIVDECGQYYHVQWTGYDEDEGTWETKAKVKRICPRAVLDWQHCKKQTLSASIKANWNTTDIP